MTDTKLLCEKIDNSGMGIDSIADALNLTDNGLSKKLDNKSSFTAAEIYTLCKLLKIESTTDKIKIFYPESLHASKLCFRWEE
nr:toxin-antitoxin system, antitoxin component, Xre family protein [uncultured Butyrivibrio sp.]